MLRKCWHCWIELSLISDLCIQVSPVNLQWKIPLKCFKMFSTPKMLEMLNCTHNAKKMYKSEQFACMDDPRPGTILFYSPRTVWCVHRWSLARVPCWVGGLHACMHMHTDGPPRLANSCTLGQKEHQDWKIFTSVVKLFDIGREALGRNSRKAFIPTGYVFLHDSTIYLWRQQSNREHVYGSCTWKCFAVSLEEIY